MALNKYNIKKWYLMLTGRSILHVNQEIGKNYSKVEIKGYYNDLTEKITRSEEQLGELPMYTKENGDKYYFSIGVFQYGLAAYDLYLLNNEEKYLDCLKKTADWAIDNQDTNGGWNSFEYENPYSSMAQGEGISLLLRAYKEFDNEKYLLAAKSALNFMKKSVSDGGVTIYENEDLILKEYPTLPVVLNGWIFSIFGIYDYCLVEKEDIETKCFLQKTIKTLEKYLPAFDIGYWSKYDNDKKIASPFYHKLHTQLLMALYDLTDIEIFKEYSEKWEKCEKNKFNKIRAFIKKAYQKIRE